MITVTELYRQLSIASLLELRTAFQLDKAGTVDPTTRGFCDHRLHLIALELQSRGHVDTPQEHWT